MPLKSPGKLLWVATGVALSLVILGSLTLTRQREENTAVSLITVHGIHPSQTSNPYYHWIDDRRILRLRYQPTNNTVYLEGEEIDTQTGQIQLLPLWGRVPYWTHLGSLAASPNGKRLLFSNRTGSESKAVLASADGSYQERIPVIGNHNLFVWLPDGHRFLSQVEKDRDDCFVRVYDTASPDKPNVMRHPAIQSLLGPDILGIDATGTITAIDLRGMRIADNGPGRYRLIFNHPMPISTPATPDSQQKSFTLLRFTPSPTNATSTVSRVTIPLPLETDEVRLVLSPDGKRVLMLTRREERLPVAMQWLQRRLTPYIPGQRRIRQRIIVCSVGGTGYQELDNRVFESASDTPYPCWLPNGKQVSFFVRDRLYRVDAPVTP